MPATCSCPPRHRYAALAGRLRLVPVVSLFAVANPDAQGRHAIRPGKPSRTRVWRLWTGRLCHWSILHLIGNLAAVIADGDWWKAFAALACTVTIGARCFRWPYWACCQLHSYRGLSDLSPCWWSEWRLMAGMIGRVVALA